MTMRVILKPAGMVLVLFAFAALTGMVILLNQALRAKAGTDGAPPTQIVNPGFESDYRAPIKYAAKGTLGGLLAYPWRDDSNWSPITVFYAQENNNPHSGKSCQKIVVSEVSQTEEARLQFAQLLALPHGKRFKGTVWLRSDNPIEVDVMIRQEKEPYRYFGVNKMPVSTTWRKAEVTGTITEPGNSYLMIKVSKPTTLYVDDATIEEIKE